MKIYIDLSYKNFEIQAFYLKVWGKLNFIYLLYRSFGCILFELIELRRAYNQETSELVMNAILKDPIPLLDSDYKDFNLILKK